MENMLQYLALPVTLLGIYAILAMSLQLILGGAGLLSLGHAAYFAVGGYASGVFTVILAPQWGISDPTIMLLGALVVGLAAAAFAGLVVALPCLRLQGDYLAMATLGFGEIMSTVFKNIDMVGGTRGFKDLPKLTSPWMIWIAAGLVALFLTRFYRSAMGFAIRATRDDEIAARSIGISTQKAKLVAFVVGSGIAGIAGAFYVHSLQFISPDEAGFIKSVEIVLAVVIGGMLTLRGSFLGALILVAVPELLRFAPEAISQKRMLFFSVVVIVLMIVNPKGLASLFDRFKRTAKAPLAPGAGPGAGPVGQGGGR